MYSGALLATAARLAWDPSTYTWFRFLCAAQYRVSAAYVFAAGVWLAALVYLAAAAAQRRARTCLHVVSTHLSLILTAPLTRLTLVLFHHPLSTIGTRGAGDRSIDILICHLVARADSVLHS